MIKRRKESGRGEWPEDLLQLQCYVHRLRDAFAELAYTLPVSTTSCERSFCTLQIVKSYRSEIQYGKRQTTCLAARHRARASDTPAEFR